MSFLKVLGGIGKGVLKGVGVVGKTAVNIAGNVVGVGNIIPTNNNGGAQQATVASVNPYVPDGLGQQSAGRSLLDIAKGIGVGLEGMLMGRNHIQVDANVGAGGRAADIYGSPSSSGLPSWLLPAGIIGGILLLVSGGGKRRRY